MLESVVPSLPGLKITYLGGFNVWSWMVIPQLLSKSHREFLGIYCQATALHLFINSIFEVVLSSGSKIILYADDLALYKAINNNQDLLDLQIDIDTICS